MLVFYMRPSNILDLQSDHTQISRIDESENVWLDKFTVNNLELFHAPGEGAKSLIQVIDKTVSPAGSRLLKRWLALPLKNISLISERQDIVEFFSGNNDFTGEMRSLIKQTGDMERMNSKISAQRMGPRDVVQLKNALFATEEIQEKCIKSGDKNLINISDKLNPCVQIRNRIEKEINNDPPAQIQKGKVIAEGVNTELDELRNIAYSGKDYLANLQRDLAYKTGIDSLKISFNNVFGYYFEVRNKYKNMVPESWIRKQTLVSAERYINQE